MVAWSTLQRGIFAAVVQAGLLIGCASTGVDQAVAPQLRLDHPQALPKVEFSTSAVHELPSVAGRRYQVWVDLPASYAASDKRLPVVFVTDPNWAFPVVRTVRNFTGQRGRNIEDFILVGLTHDPDKSGAESRARDYTPTNPRRDPAHDPGDYDFPEYGEAAAYRDYIETRVFPLIAANYRADMGRKTYIGHSYGSLFGTYVLLTRPGMFGNYILGSPSLWFDRHAIVRMEADGARARRDLRANVHMVTGSYEAARPEPRYNSKNDLVEDMRRFEKTLTTRGYPSLTVTSEVAEGEDHLTVYPDVVSRGLIRLLPGHGPYSGG